MTNPVGWVGTRADGTTVEFLGAPPGEAYAGQFASVSELTTQADYETAVEASWTASTVARVPQIIERRQFFQQLAIQTVISNAEALAALATGTIPAALMALVTGLPAGEQFAAQMLIIGAPTFNRADPLTLDLGTAKGWTPAQIDALWTAAAAL